MFSGTHYGIKVDMGWLKDDVDGLKQVVDFLNKDNIKLNKIAAQWPAKAVA